MGNLDMVQRRMFENCEPLTRPICCCKPQRKIYKNGFSCLLVDCVLLSKNLDPPGRLRSKACYLSTLRLKGVGNTFE